MHSRLTDELRNKILARLSSEPSDTKLAKEFGVSRKTIWRLRQEPNPPVKTEAIPPPPPGISMAPVEVPPNPVPDPNRKPSSNGIHRPVSETASVATPSDVLPKVDAGPAVLKTYFAVQLLRGENYSHVAQAVLEAADKKGVLFRKLQVMDIQAVGTTSFVRFRSDMVDAEAIRELPNRAIILSSADGYQAYFPNGRVGKFPASAMCLGPKVGFGQIFAGTRIKRWKQQFAA